MSIPLKRDALLLTKDPDRAAKLRRKSEEYAQRCRHMAPEVDPCFTFRLRLLHDLLHFQIVDIDAFEARCRQEPYFSEAKFLEALAVIEAYNSGKLSKIRGGTGLK